LKKALNIKHKDILKIWLNDSQIIMEKMKSRNEQKVMLLLKEQKLGVFSFLFAFLDDQSFTFNGYCDLLSRLEGKAAVC